MEKSKPISIVEQCMSKFPFDDVQRLALSSVNIVLEGFYDRVFLSSELLTNKLIQAQAKDLIEGYKQGMSGHEFAKLLHELSSSYIVPVSGHYTIGSLVLFLPGLIKQYIDFRVIGDLLSQSCKMEDSRSFFQKLDNVDDLTRDVAYAIDFFLRNPYNHTLFFQPPFTIKMTNTLRKLTLPYIDGMINTIKNATVKEMVTIARCGYETREAKYKLSSARFSEIPMVAAIANSVPKSFKIDLEQIEQQFTYFFGNKNVVDAVKTKLIKEFEDIKARCIVDETQVYNQITSVMIPGVRWLGDYTYAILDGNSFTLGTKEVTTWKS